MTDDRPVRKAVRVRRASVTTRRYPDRYQRDAHVEAYLWHLYYIFKTPYFSAEDVDEEYWEKAPDWAKLWCYQMDQ